MDMAVKNDGNKRKSGMSVRYIVTDAVIILFFLSVIVFYHSRLYSQTRHEIIKEGEFAAIQTADQIDKYLSSGTEAMRLISYSLDHMIRDGRSQSEIYDFLVRQSIAIADINYDITNGFYGFIRGEYLDGVGWVPDEDYVPTERPWYIYAQANIGSVAVVEPYLDMNTHTVLISLSKTLCDAKSVVAMDYPITYLQSVTEKIHEDNASQKEIVLDGKYQVIAHSDPSEVGKAYVMENGTFGRALVTALQESDTNSLSMDFEGKTT